MAKWADYLISEVEIFENTNSKHVSRVMLHVDDGGNYVNVGVLRTKDEVINLIRQKSSVCTIKWDYIIGQWVKGAEVITEDRNGILYLRTHANATTTDNLLHLIRIK